MMLPELYSDPPALEDVPRLSHFIIFKIQV